jgi:hypothetical protein
LLSRRRRRADFTDGRHRWFAAPAAPMRVACASRNHPGVDLLCDAESRSVTFQRRGKLLSSASIQRSSGDPD